MFAVTGYEISLWLHITAAVLGLGAAFATTVLFQVALAGDLRNMPLVHQTQRAINMRLANPALLLIVLTGFYQVSEGNWEMGSFWISATIMIVIVIGALNGAYFSRTDKKLGAMAVAEIAAAGTGQLQLSSEYLQQVRQERGVGLFVGLLVILAVLLMVIKPGA